MAKWYKNSEDSATARSSDLSNENNKLRSNTPAISRRGYLKAATSASAVTGLTGLSGCLGILGDDGGGGTVRMSYVPTSALAPLLLAIEEGYFEERDIEVQLERMPTSQIYPQLQTGQLDAAHIALSASIFNTIADGINIRMVADVVRTAPNVPALTRIMIHEDLYEEGMTIADLPDNFTWALITDAGVNEYLAARELQVRGMTWDDVEITTMQFPDMIPAMASDSIDVASIAFPLAAQMQQETGAQHYRYFSEPAPELQVAGILFGESILEDRPEVGRGWLEAYVEGIHEYYDRGYYDDQIISIVNDYLEIPEPALRASPPQLHHKNGRLLTDSIMGQQEFLDCRGYLNDTVDEDEIIDHSLLEEALDNVGRADNPEPSPGEFDAMVANTQVPFPELQEEYDLSGFPDESIC